MGVGNISAIFSKKEQVSLLMFKHSVQDDYGMLSSWVGNECCMWGGIKCDGVTRNVQHLHLRGDYYNYYYITVNKVSSSVAPGSWHVLLVNYILILCIFSLDSAS